MPAAKVRGWVAITGRDAVNTTERLVCGTGAVPTAARAEGFALAGRPAATLIDSADERGPSADPTVGEVGWVHHRIGAGSPGARKGFAVELIAGDAQEAADHCLVAHRIAGALDRPCLCNLDEIVAKTPGFACLPALDQIAALLDTSSTEIQDPQEAAARAFEFVSSLTGRDCAPLASEAVDAADCVLVAQGSARAAAHRIAARLREEGTRCGVVGVALIEPFPLEGLSALLTGKQAVAVVSNGSDGEVAALSAWVRSAAASTPDVVLFPVKLSGDFERDCAETRIALGLQTGAVSASTQPGTSRAGITLGIAPATEWGESFLLGVAARLRGLGPLTLVRPASPIDGTTTLEISPAGGGCGADKTTLDVLLAPDLVSLAKSAGFEALRPDGAAVLYGDPNSHALPAAGLSAAQRAAFIVRDLRLFRLVHEAETSPAPVSHSVFELHLTGALLAAVPELGKLVDCEDVLAALGERDDANADEIQSIGRGEAALESLEVAAIDAELQASAEESPSAHVPPQMAEQPASGETERDPAWAAALQHFHLTGEGAHSSAEPPPGMPLLPLALETLDLPTADLQPATLSSIYTEVASGARLRLRHEFLDRVRLLTGRLGEFLGYPDNQGTGSPGKNLSGSLGAVSDSFFDTDKLSEMLPRAAAADLSPARRERVERVWRSLKAFSGDDSGTPDLIVVHPPGMSNLPDGRGVRLVSHADGLRAAVGIFDALALVDAVRATHIAELELRHAYKEAIHDRPFARFNWQSLSTEELLLLPQVLVLESGARLRGPSLAALSELLHSGRPIHVLVEERLSELQDSGDESLTGYHAGIGYLAVAHREAFVLQSSLGTPDHLGGGLRRMATSVRPSVALVTTPDWHSAVPPMLQLAAAHAGRATPAFLFDPSAGSTWAERFDLSGNPQVEAIWPRGSVRYLDAGGSEQSRDEALTFVHAAALLTAFRRHFRVIPREAGAADQLEIAEWLELPDGKALRTLPFIRVHGGGGQLARAVLTRELAFACRDRARSWRIFEELAGTGATAEAVSAAPELPVVEEGSVEDRKAQLEFAGQAAVHAAMHRLVQALVDPNGETIPVELLATPTETAVVSPAAASAVTQPEVPVARPAPIEGPFIDTVLCTTCNECINLNPRLFVYDENKQARIGDPAAGTFKQLVMAAEKCPARCIHPGAPRDGDSSATEAMISRAAPFQ